ncbi:lymphatic vessel endothelial hyaluronic acid receptor 1a [Polymixia lowei]
MIWLWIVSLLPFPLAISSQIKVFPAFSGIAGVSQITYIDDNNQSQYAFNASEARELCLSLGLTIASKAQVQEALTQGLETCRFGWIDENFVVIPRINANPNCGQNKTGLVKWRASVKKVFDGFCFNESAADTVAQLKDTTVDSPSTTRDYPEHAPFPSNSTTSISDPQRHDVRSTHPTLSTFDPQRHDVRSTHPTLSTSGSRSSRMDTGAETTQFISRAQGSAGAKALLITSICGLLLTAIAIIGYVKLNKMCSLSWDVKQQQESSETDDCTDVKNIKDVEEEVRIELDNTTR